MSSLVAVEPPFGESGYGFDIKEEEEALLVNGKANDLFRSHTNEKATGPQGFFISRIAKSIGLKFVIITMIIYGLDQGGVESLVGLPQVYFYKQRGLTPAETTRVMSFAGISWSIKPLFALIMDAFPIMSWHFRPYMIFFGTLGTIGYFLISSAGVAGTLSISSCVGMYFLGMNALVWNDTALDGLTTQKVKEHPELDVELSSLQQVALMSTAMIMSLLTGFLVDVVGLSWIFGAAALFSGATTCAIVLLPEKKDSGSISPRSVLSRFMSIITSFFNEFNSDIRNDGAAKNGGYLLGKMTIYGVIAVMTIDLDAAMVYWYEDVAHYSRGFQGAVVTMGWAFGLLAVIVNASYLKGVGYRTLFVSFQLVQTAVSCLDLLLVCVAKDSFWGHFIAISDRVGTKAMNKLKMIVIIAMICLDTPEQGETSVVAIINALTNFAGTNFVSPMAGSLVLGALNISKGNYGNLPWAIVLRTLCRLIPIPFVYLLVPKGSSLDRTKRFEVEKLESINDEDEEANAILRSEDDTLELATK